MTLFDAAGSTEADAPAAPAGPLVRVRMTIAYHGGPFRGFAAQPGQVTVAGALVEALRTVLGGPVEIACAGRTDAGVHAAGQVVHVDVTPGGDRARGRAPSGVDVEALKRSLNRMLAPHIAVLRADLAPAGFDARRSALWRRYRYTVLNRSEPDPFLAGLVWHVEDPLELRPMTLACDPIHGEHDFASFCRRPPNPEAGTVRRVMRAGWTAEGPLLRFEIVASSFCHQMVRSLVGTMVDVGRGRLVAGDMAYILRCRDRSMAGGVAPPQGLVLEEVGYPADAELLSAGSRR